MKKVFFQIIIAQIYLFPQINKAVTIENSKIEASKYEKPKPRLTRGLGTMHRHEINWSIHETGFHFMPKMNNYWAFPTVSGIGYSFRPFHSSNTKFKPHFLLQAFASISAYDYKSFRVGSKVYHKMVFENGSESLVETRYTNHISQYYLGIKFNFLEKKFVNDERFFRVFIEGNIGLSHFRSRMKIPDPEHGWGECVPIIADITINRHIGGIFRTGLGVDFGKYNNDGFWFFKIGYLGSFRSFEYANQNFLDKEPRHAIHDNNGHQSQQQHHSREIDVYADFINVFTADVHKHKVSEIYRSHLRFVYLNFGLTITIPQ